LNKPFYILFFLFVSISFGEGWGEVSAQTNLIYNGDFELYDTCPLGVGELNSCTGWSNPTAATPEYFNTCNGTTNSVNIPNNIAGFQNTFNGNGYAGFIAFEYSAPYWWFEYVQGKLVQPLTMGHKYLLEFYVSCGEGYADIAISKIGAYFSTMPISRSDALPLSVSPQVLNLNGQITDTSSWTKISGVFVSSGNEQFITIGYFSDTLITDSIRIQTFPFIPTISPRTYYYLDGIMLNDVTPEISIPNIFTPNGDGINDLLNISIIGLTDIQFIIYNRWGNIIFETNKEKESWDGHTTSGEKCIEGTYYYVLKAKNGMDDFSKKGFIQLLR